MNLTYIIIATTMIGVHPGQPAKMQVVQDSEQPFTTLTQCEVARQMLFKYSAWASKCQSVETGSI